MTHAKPLSPNASDPAQVYPWAGSLFSLIQATLKAGILGLGSQSEPSLGLTAFIGISHWPSPTWTRSIFFLVSQRTT